MQLRRLKFKARLNEQSFILPNNLNLRGGGDHKHSFKVPVNNDLLTGAKFKVKQSLTFFKVPVN